MRNRQDDIVVVDEDNKANDRRVTMVEVTPEGVKDRVLFDGDNIIVKLNHPIKCRFRRNGVEVDELLEQITFRPVCGGDLRALASFRDEEEKSIRLFMRLSGLTEPQFDALRVSDIEFCMEAIDSFLSGGRTTGKN